ncbi:MAG: heme lyase CcmF/NrfE family subunit [Pseudomonadota bacterium]
MIAEIGLGLLWFAAALALMQLGLGVIILRDQDSPSANAYAATLRPLAVIQGVMVALSFLCLIQIFWVTDLSVKLVATNSHSLKPWLYKLAGAWGNHEGSMLLWVTVMAVSGALVAMLERRISQAMMIATLAAQAFVSIGFYAFLLLSSNPFERLVPTPPEGAGLNPLLQDPGLAFHPPTLYFGYVGLSIAFSFAVGALVTREVGPTFARAMRPWVLGAWIFLTLGITAGSYWAYYELGWGGWWFWDPVENASLMPWLAATALLHSVTVLANRGALKAWTVMLAVVAFSMSMVGTFLVRSGILTSVHAFAVDPERGSFILVLLAIYIGGALALFGLRASTVQEGAKFQFLSREAALVANNLLLMGILAIVLMGTLYPLVTEASGTKVSIGPPYFNPASAIFFIPMVLIMAVGPMLRWRKSDKAQLTAAAAAPLLAGAVALLLVVIFGSKAGILPTLGLALAATLAVASVMPLFRSKANRASLPIWGMVVAHLGVAVTMAGMASESAFTKETLVASAPGESHQVADWAITLLAVEPVAGRNWTALEARLSAQRGEGEAIELAPQARMFSSPPTNTSEAALLTRWDGQLYAVIGERAPDGRWQLRLWWKPFVPLIWYGGIMIGFGGLLALIGRLFQLSRTRPVRKVEQASEPTGQTVPA